jgi:transcriptional regulator with XRE-family HTH domain
MPSLPSPPKTLIDALAAAALSAQGKTQVQIAEALDLSQSAVSRLLNRKDVLPYINIERRFLWDEFPEPFQQEIRRRMSHREIGDRVARLAREHNQPAPAVHVVPMGESREPGKQFDAFAPPAAMALRDLLEDVRGRVGVAWGSTIWYTVQALRSILPQRPIRRQLPIDFVPLCGDPLIDSLESYADRTSSRIVSELSKAVNGDELRPAWLGLVPAFIPRTFKGRDIRVIDRLIDLVPQYPRIFGRRIPQPGPAVAPMVGDLHMIITAAGPAKRPLGFGKNPLLGLTEAQSRTLAENIHGDIGGVLLPRLAHASGKDGGEPAPDPLVRDLMARWTGLKIEHLKECSRRAFAEGGKSRPGVTLLSFGTDHVEVVLEAVRRGLVNQLIIGSDLEEALAEVLPRGSAGA